jgi:hypothetical protein
VLELVRPKEEDVVFDLGSGDGRFLLAFAAAIREAATAKQGPVVVGYELDAALASLSRNHATAAGLAHLVEVREEGNARTFSSLRIRSSLCTVSSPFVWCATLTGSLMFCTDLMQADLAPASIIVAYLLPDALRSLIPKVPQPRKNQSSCRRTRSTRR